MERLGSPASRSPAKGEGYHSRFPRQTNYWRGRE